MKARRQRRGGPSVPTRTLEERLHEVRDDLKLLASIFEAHSVAPEYLQSDLLAPPACRAASNLAARSATTVENVLNSLPPGVLGHS